MKTSKTAEPILTSIAFRTSKALAAIVVLLLLSSAQPAATFSLTVEVSGIKHQEGLMNIGLFSDGGTFPDRSKARDGALVKVSGDVVRHSFHKLPAGTYSVAIFHDRNSNGRLDKNLFGIPTEGFGFSNDAIGSFGPPSFRDAAVTLQGNKTIKIRLRHY